MCGRVIERAVCCCSMCAAAIEGAGVRGCWVLPSCFWALLGSNRLPYLAIGLNRITHPFPSPCLAVGKEKFVTGAYRRKLEEDKKWAARQEAK